MGSAYCYQTEFHGNPFSGSLAYTRERTDMKLIDASRDYANAPRNQVITRMCL
jgi:hypothetical protein